MTEECLFEVTLNYFNIGRYTRCQFCDDGVARTITRSTVDGSIINAYDVSWRVEGGEVVIDVGNVAVEPIQEAYRRYLARLILREEPACGP